MNHNVKQENLVIMNFAHSSNPDPLTRCCLDQAFPLPNTLTWMQLDNCNIQLNVCWHFCQFSHLQFYTKDFKTLCNFEKVLSMQLLEVLSIVLVNVTEVIERSLPWLQIYCNCAKPLVWRLPTHATCLACCFLVFLGMSHCSMTTFNLVNFKSQILASAAMSALFTNWLMLFDSPVSSKMWRIEATCNLCIVICDKIKCTAYCRLVINLFRWLILYKITFTESNACV